MSDRLAEIRAALLEELLDENVELKARLAACERQRDEYRGDREYNEREVK